MATVYNTAYLGMVARVVWRVGTIGQVEWEGAATWYSLATIVPSPSLSNIVILSPWPHIMARLLPWGQQAGYQVHNEEERKGRSTLFSESRVQLV